MTMPGADSRESSGIEAIKGKHEWWNATFEVLDGKVEGPLLHGEDRFAVIFQMTARNKSTGEEQTMHEVGIYTVDDGGKIVREEFFYA
jgi:cytochrome oxidase Cu insertion factor (SCO1/SenC/PrrC family)